MVRTRGVSVPGISLLLLLGFSTAGRADVVLDWNEVALDAIQMDRTAPPKAGRALACVHVAIFDAINSVSGGPFTPYLVQPVEFVSPVSAEAAAASAAHDVLVELFPAQEAAFDAALAASLAEIPNGTPETNGVDWGKSVAQQIMALRGDDGSGTTVSYEPPTGANWWAPTPPGFAAPLLPNWPSVTPWTMTHASQFRQGPPPASTSPEYTAAFLEVQRLGEADSPHRTAEQSQIALFWADGPGTATPPGHWHVIAQDLSRAEGLNIFMNARLFALLAMANADAAIVSWDHKYYYSSWRPVTGIQHADTDGNPATTADPAWTSFIATPPFPSYTSGHSTFSSASARIIALFIGTDAISFSTTSDALPGVTRSFTSLSDAAEEAGQSRIYGGIHWQFDNEAGLSSGQALAEHVFFNFLTPTQPSSTCLPGSTTLCLAGGRFKVQADWTTASAHGPAHAVKLGDDSGTFWFFDEDNTELTLKVLNACDDFDRFWVFASGLTNVEVLVTVTDTKTGSTRQYFNPQGKPFAPVQDTNAFATCP
ncbi:MAG TPA: vanadium-dependent haloperoxidase [Thermoanaerobaculia bacterium]|nr:vanadium-dependent haloperoxidase [Thermoanaerobaculia bacterium]